MNTSTERPLQIFLAEDNRADVYLVELALKEQDLKFVLNQVHDGEAALKHVERLGREEPIPDIALLDLNLPKQEGDQILLSLRSHPCCTSMPIVIMTSSENMRDRAIADQYGAHFFSKPSDLGGFLKLGALVKSLVKHL